MKKKNITILKFLLLVVYDWQNKSCQISEVNFLQNGTERRHLFIFHEFVNEHNLNIKLRMYLNWSTLLTSE